MNESPFDLVPHQKVLAVAEALDAAEIPHAFGGAIVLLYWSEPRATYDIDVNVFLRDEYADRAFSALAPLGVTIPPDAPEVILKTSQIRLDWDGVLVDLFFAFDEFHKSIQNRAVPRDFRGREILIVTAEDIVTLKSLFNRPKDWIDIETIIATQGGRFDGDYALDWLTRILGEGDAALERLRGLIEEYRLNPA